MYASLPVEARSFIALRFSNLCLVSVTTLPEPLTGWAKVLTQGGRSLEQGTPAPRAERQPR